MLPASYVGQSTSASVTLTNQGGASVTFAPSIDPPFSVATGAITLARGEAAPLSVTFTPIVVGRASGVLRAGELEVEVEAEGLEVPQCVASSVCVASSFDFAAAVCREAPKLDGTVCESSCVIGACEQGTCIGQLKGCDDSDACTVDGCSETAGCSHAPRVCPVPQNPCRVATCDSATGCGLEDAPDGTLCGPDNCVDLEVDICITGQCQRRLRPATGRCANRWMPMSIPGRAAHAMAWDAARGKIILFGGGFTPTDDTWEWDGTSWTQRTPVGSPPPRNQHRVAYDAFRQRIVLFGGLDAQNGLLGDTWEWDGVTWVQRTPAVSPPARAEHTMVYDRARKRVVLFSGRSSNGYLPDTWEWDGSRWTQRTPVVSPPARYLHAMAYDETRERVVVFGGYGVGGIRADHWEWDGVSWVERTLAVKPPARAYHSMAWDAVRARVVLFSGAESSGAVLRDTWEWDGTSWTRRTPVTEPPGRGHSELAYDGNTQSVLLFAGYENANGPSMRADTWAWDGANWTERAIVARPPSRSYEAMAYDASRQRAVLFGGYGNNGVAGLGDTWEWDGARWTERIFSSQTPPGRGQTALAYDAARQRVVLFGGVTQFTLGGVTLADTWELDGQGWSRRTPVTSPPARANHHLAYDSSRQRVVLVGGSSENDVLFTDTWEWDGVNWTERLPASTPPGNWGRAIAYDGARQRAVLFGGFMSNETWAWDGNAWALLAPATSPAARGGHAMAYDSMRQRVLMFGGFEMPNLYAETWEWDGATWSQRLPVTSPLGSFGHAMVYDAARQRVVLFQDDDTWLFLP